MAVFVVADDASVRDELLALCQASLARYKWPREIFVVDDLPKSSLGKIRKDVLSGGLPEIDLEGDRPT